MTRDQKKQRRLVLRDLQEYRRKRNKSYLQCDLCNRRKEDVILCNDPYIEQLGGGKVERYLCDNCFNIQSGCV